MNYKREADNCIFYISDMDRLPSKGHFSKMDNGRDMAYRIKDCLGSCDVMKFCAYGGELLDKKSVGIIFPAHSWGVSLAVYSFINHLRVTEGTYVYAVAAGESLFAGGECDENLNSIAGFAKAFDKNGLGGTADIYVRKNNVKRQIEYMDEMEHMSDVRRKLARIMRTILCYSLDVPSQPLKLRSTYNAAYDTAFDGAAYKHDEKAPVRGARSLSNVFLDEEYLSGVRLCRVM